MRNRMAFALLLIAVMVSGCQQYWHDDETYYEDQYGVHTDYYTYPSAKYHEEDYYYRGSPYRNPYEYHHHGYGSGY